eukprot:SAG31_NODE_544_length_14245_cov_68.376644_2_plen_90_part_00
MASSVIVRSAVEQPADTHATLAYMQRRPRTGAAGAGRDGAAQGPAAGGKGIKGARLITIATEGVLLKWSGDQPVLTEVRAGDTVGRHLL